MTSDALPDHGVDDRLTGLVAKDQIRDLAMAYAWAVDDHDIDTVVGMFTEDGIFDVSGEVAAGHDEIRKSFVASMSRFTTMLHTPEIHLIEIKDTEHAVGRATGHAELAFRDTLMLTAYRYRDRYVRHDGVWRFAERHVRFMYAVPIESMATAFGDTKRIRWPQNRYQHADYPESASTWNTYRET
ncbi:nuclear transport factor 2 family protein [Gordonia sp. HNM0687]|uniref:Nuclear transport factor 2 family protein n=1 Tax=Gordonia mangrovi TaxID=2665643 RepID=A0A6L7GX83_9ACTN|nr:nuclear transport factor 2 family protein [Gordonia mangrovi]MXP24233.1 nuclear transport factor 2 family protein [Gordonia mangrovi]UVF79946.1 nuclear transport factor 2 family protein [Gordonia mangrovi]